MIYDVVIIGGGSAGMMAAGQAGARGARALLIEKNNSLGKKLLITGNGRCNITNIQADNKQSIGVYGPNAKFLFSAFNKFSVDDTMNFFNALGVATKIEEHGRVFPESDQAIDVQSALVKYLKKNQVEVMFEASVKKIIQKDNSIEKIVLENGEEIIGKNFVITTGGKSYPNTGSSGDAYAWLISLGHKVVSPRPALTSLVVKEKNINQLEGLSMKDVGLSLYQNSKKIVSRLGEIVFTSNGVSGPAVLDLSSQIGRLSPSLIQLRIDFQPEIEARELEKKIQNDFHHSNNKIIKNYLLDIVSPKLVSLILDLTGIEEKKQVSVISKIERQAIINVLKEFTLEVEELKDFSKAMITAGGVEVKEINPKTMGSKLYKNLFFAGEILDVDGPSGGYNLQICWSTGFTAGDSVCF